LTCKLRLRRSTSTTSPIQNISKNSHAEPKKIAVKVFGETTRTEEINAQKQIAGNIALTALQNI
jgi:predicted secreted protein